MRNKSFVDCFVLMGTALSLRGGKSLPEMGRPLIQEISPTFINLSLTLEEFSISNFKNMEFELTGILNQQWIDPRLGANEETRKKAVAGQIWKPKIVNINGKSKIVNNEDTIFWRGFGKEGNVLLSEKIQIIGTCTMNLRDFPFDAQFCQLKFGTYRFPYDEVFITWDQQAIEINTFENNEFCLSNVTTFTVTDIRRSGNFSTAIVQFKLQRHSTHYILCTFIPCNTMILLNYMGLWLSINKRDKRFILNLLSLFLTVCLYYISVCLTYSVSYLKALDIFILICGCFNMFLLSETIFIDILCNIEEQIYSIKIKACTKEYPKYVQWLEFGMKLVTPLVYIFFIAIYYATYFTENVG